MTENEKKEDSKDKETVLPKTDSDINDVSRKGLKDKDMDLKK